MKVCHVSHGDACGEEVTVKGSEPACMPKLASEFSSSLHVGTLAVYT